MQVYISPVVVAKSFTRLAYIQKSNHDGKRGLERTSSMMYFFAFDCVAKKHGSEAIDIDNATFDGANTRADFVLEYTKLVALKNGENGELRHVASLGTIQIGGKAPDGKMRSNFLSVPVVKASLAKAPYAYPLRPAPLLLLGAAATGFKYGIKYHPDWKKNLNLFLSDMNSSTPYTDLAIFLCRTEHIEVEDTTSGQEVLFTAMRTKFSNTLAEIFISKIKNEKLFSAKTVAWNDFTAVDFFDSIAEKKLSRKDELKNLSKEQLVELILKLEKK